MDALRRERLGGLQESRGKATYRRGRTSRRDAPRAVHEVDSLLAVAHGRGPVGSSGTSAYGVAGDGDADAMIVVNKRGGEDVQPSDVAGHMV